MQFLKNDPRPVTDFPIELHVKTYYKDGDEVFGVTEMNSDPPDALEKPIQFSRR